MQNELTETEKNDEDAIKQRIREAIKSKGLKIKQFARESGMAYPSLRDYFSGLRKPGFDAIASILRFTGVSGDWLLQGKGFMKPDLEPQLANVDEGLLGHIAQRVERAFLKENPSSGAELVRDGDPPGYLDSRPLKEVQRKLNSVGEHTVIAASVYNRVAHINDSQQQEAAIITEVDTLVRLNKSIIATQIHEDDLKKD